MKRDPRLRPLSRDHQAALVLGRRAVSAADSDRSERVTEAWEEVRRRFPAELGPHFEVEERWLLPPLREAGESALADQVQEDHRALRELAESADGRDTAARLSEFGTRLREHVRREEHEVFPTAERVLSDDQLQAIERACAGPEG